MNRYPVRSYSSICNSGNMQYDTFNVEPTPADEECLQVGSPLYEREQAIIENTAHINQLIRCYGEPPEGTSFIISSNEHDFGTYYDIIIRFKVDDNEGEEQEENSKGCDYALKCEMGATTTNELGEVVNKWDKEALEELKAAGYVLFKEPIKVEFEPRKIIKLKQA